jgi:aminobenzoyl-glutamate transport protein
MSKPHPTRRSVLDWIEYIGNKLPEPALIFVILMVVVIAVAALGDALGWQVTPIQPRVVMEPALDGSGAPMLGTDGAPMLVPAHDEAGRVMTELVPTGAPIESRSLLTRDGIYWMLSSMLRNFTGLPALGLIFVAMLGIGLAEKFGFFSALMRALAFITPRRLLTPAILLIGANSSVASDAGYIILPPLAAALYMAVGRHPIAGLAAAFAGVAGGFGAGFFPTGGDGALTGFAQDAARVIDPDYTVNYLHNAWFKVVSAIVVMFAGWVVTDLIVEPRLRRAAPEAGTPDDAPADDSHSGDPTDATADATTSETPSSDPTTAAVDMALTPAERRGLTGALLTMALVLGGFAALILVPDMPLYGSGQPTLSDGRVILHHAVEVLPAETPVEAASHDILAREPLLVIESEARPRLAETPGERWSHVIVPIIFFAFLIPGIVYGFLVGRLRTQRDLVDAFYHGVHSIVPVLTIAFFMAQFVNYFAYTRLDRMLAYAGGSMLVSADLPVPTFLVLFVTLVVFGDFALSGMLSKFGVMAPIFIPMFMMAGMSPELTTAAYRIGDSVVNIITPLNSYLLIILAVLQKYNGRAGLGTLIGLMVPYSVVFFFAWTALLLVWWMGGWPLGPDSPLTYVPPH